MSEWREFGGVNEGYVLELYERFQKDPSSVDAATRALFERQGAACRTSAPSPTPAPSTAPGTQHQAPGTLI